MQMKSQFLNEIAQQPNALRDLIGFYRGRDGLARLRQWVKLARQQRRIVFAGMGTSEFAPELILETMGRAKIDATTVDAGELLHHPRFISGMLVLISQSGESVETRKVAESRQRGSFVAITNNEDSTLGRRAGLALPMCAGAETAISTKTYINTMAVLFLMSAALRGAMALKEALRQLEKLAEKMSKVDRKGIAHAAGLLSDTGVVHFIARGPALVAAKQGALTFMEGTRSSCAAFSGGSFRHGPFELVDRSHRAIVYIDADSKALLNAMAREMARKKGRVVVITDQAVRMQGASTAVLRIPAAGKGLFAIAAATTQELLLDAVAKKRGVIAGIFRYGSKITSRE